MARLGTKYVIEVEREDTRRESLKKGVTVAVSFMDFLSSDVVAVVTRIVVAMVDVVVFFFGFSGSCIYCYW